MPDSPRTRLIANQRLADAHFGVVHSADFEAVCDLTLLKVVQDATGELIMPDAAARHFFVAGARYALEALQTIADPSPQPSRPQRTDRLEP